MGPNTYVEYMAISDIMEVAQHIKDIFNQLKEKIASGEVKANVVDFLEKLKAVVDAKIAVAKPIVRAALEKVKAAVDEMIAKANANIAEGIEQGKGLLVQLLAKIMVKLAELKDNLAGYNIFDDLLNDVLKPALGKAIENLIPTIQKHLGDLIDKLVPKAEYLAITDIMEIAQHIKDIFNELKAKIASGEVKASVIDFLKHLKEVVDAKIAEATPIVQAALAKVQAAVDEMIAKIEAEIEAGIVETGKGILSELLEKIMAKLAELKDQVAGYNIFDDLLNDVLKPAVKHAIENLIPTIAKHLGDLADKLKPKEYISIVDIMEAAAALKDIFDQVKAKIESGEVKDNILDFLEKIKAVVEKVDAAVKAVIAKAKNHIETGKGILVDLLETIIAKIGELKDNVAGYNIFDDLLNDVLKPALKKAIENLIPTIAKHLGDLAGKITV